MYIKIDKIVSREKLLFYLLLILLLIERYAILTNYNFLYVGNDDTIFWQAAKDYSQGIFHEPYFYGQNYNFMLEAFLAAPLIKFGLPSNYALPLITAFLALFPFIFSATVLYRKNEIVTSLVFLAIPLCLPIEYGMLTSMSRGFVQGLFFSGFFIFSILDPGKKTYWLVSGLALGAGYFSNPNSLIVAFPVCLFLLFKNIKNISFYWISLLAVVPFLIVEYFAKTFYIIHPEFNVHPLMSISFDFNQMISNFQHLSDFFTFFTPAFWYKGWLVLPLIFLLGLFLFKKDKIKSVCLLLTVMYIFITLGITKVNDSINNLLLSSARMYLGIPLFAGIAFFWAKSLFSHLEKKLTLSVVLIGVTCFSLKIGLVRQIINLNTIKTNYGCVAIKKINELKQDCFRLKCIADYHKVDLIVFVPNWIVNTADMAIYDCGCNIVENNFPTNVLSGFEKRTWTFWEEKNTIRKNVLLYGHYLEQDKVKKIKNCTVVSINPYMLLMKNNTLPIDSILKNVGINYSRY